ncbi:MAG: hypothetical protein ACKN9U_14385 [Pirellulaceae bacterium]
MEHRVRSDDRRFVRLGVFARDQPTPFPIERAIGRRKLPRPPASGQAFPWLAADPGSLLAGYHGSRPATIPDGTRNRLFEMACGSVLQSAACYELLVVCDAMDVGSSGRGGSDQGSIDWIFTRLIQRTESLSEGSVE